VDEVVGTAKAKVEQTEKILPSRPVDMRQVRVWPYRDDSRADSRPFTMQVEHQETSGQVAVESPLNGVGETRRDIIRPHGSSR